MDLSHIWKNITHPWISRDLSHIWNYKTVEVQQSKTKHALAQGCVSSYLDAILDGRAGASGSERALRWTTEQERKRGRGNM
jgi:hypothetical protein